MRSSEKSLCIPCLAGFAPLKLCESDAGRLVILVRRYPLTAESSAEEQDFSEALSALEEIKKSITE